MPTRAAHVVLPLFLLAPSLAACSQPPTPAVEASDPPGALPACLQPRPFMIVEAYVVFFDAHKADLMPRGRRALGAFARSILDDADELLVTLRGNTDASETGSVDRDLGKRRAEAAAQYLESQGISRNRIWVEDSGTSRPRLPTPPGVPEPQNRRVDTDWFGYGVARTVRQACVAWVRQNCVGKDPSQVHPSCDAALTRLEGSRLP